MHNKENPDDPTTRSSKCRWGIYVILDRVLAGKEYEQLARQALEGGARVVQLRDKDLPRHELMRIGRTLRSLTHDYRAAFIVNDDPYLAAECEADGVHLGQEDLAVESARALLGPDMIIGLSTHTFEQARAAESLPVDYISVGPVFPTKTKLSPWPVVGLELVRHVREATPMVITAIGGIREEHIPPLVQAGADNIAMIAEIMTAPDIRSKVAHLCRIYEAARASLDSKNSKVRHHEPHR